MPDSAISTTRFAAVAHRAYADGSYLGAGGYSGGALQITLGGIDGDDIFGMSGGWQHDFQA